MDKYIFTMRELRRALDRLAAANILRQARGLDPHMVWVPIMWGQHDAGQSFAISVEHAKALVGYSAHGIHGDEACFNDISDSACPDVTDDNCLAWWREDGDLELELV